MKNTDKKATPAKKTQLQELAEQREREEAQAAANTKATDKTKGNANSVQNSPLYKMGAKAAELERQQREAELAAEYAEEERKLIKIAEKEGLDAATMINDDKIEHPENYFNVPENIYSGQDVERIIDRTEKIVLESTVQDFVRLFLKINSDSSAAKDVFRVAARFFDHEERNNATEYADKIKRVLIDSDIPSEILVKVLKQIQAIPC